MQSSLYEENQLRIKLQMEVDSKDSEIEQLSQKLASASADTVSNISSGAENESEEGIQVIDWTANLLRYCHLSFFVCLLVLFGHVW